MGISHRAAGLDDMEEVLALGEQNHGLQCWRSLIRHPAFLAAVLESDSAIRGHKLIGFGCAAIVSTHFLDAELANPQPDLLARLMASLNSGSAGLLTRAEVARANRGIGIDLVLPHTVWRDAVLSERERHDAQTNLTGGFTKNIAGYRIHRILHETSSEYNNAFLARSREFRLVSAFPSLGRATYLMNRESATAMPGSVGNLIFRYHEPLLRLRESDQELLLAAIDGSTDAELATQMNLTFAAVKARWRSAYARIADVRPDLIADDFDNRDARGNQKRHRVLNYLRSHLEELRPYDWKTKGAANGE